MRLDDSALQSLAALRDPDGVLSLYVDADPAAQAAERPSWTVALKNELAQLADRVKSEGPRTRWLLLQRRLDESAGAIASILDPKESGRGRALFLPLSTGLPLRLTLDLPLIDRVVLEERAYVRPLVAALDNGRAAGLVAASRAGVVVHEALLGKTRGLVRLTFDDSTGEWREYKGPAAANPALAQQTAPQRDRFRRRLDDRRARFLDECGRQLAALAGARDWELAVVGGDPRITPPVVGALRTANRAVVEDERSFDGLPTRDLAGMLEQLVAEARRRCRIELAETALSTARTGGPAALGLGDTLAALAAGRVQHLLLDADREYEGSHAGGTLAPNSELPPGVPRAEVVAERNLDERMIERALETRARVTLLDGEAAEALLPADGVAALLRW